LTGKSKKQKPPHTMTTEEVVESLNVDPTKGLTSEEAKRRLEKHGPNIVPIRNPWFRKRLKKRE